MPNSTLLQKQQGDRNTDSRRQRHLFQFSFRFGLIPFNTPTILYIHPSRKREWVFIPQFLSTSTSRESSVFLHRSVAASALIVPTQRARASFICAILFAFAGKITQKLSKCSGPAGWRLIEKDRSAKIPRLFSLSLMEFLATGDFLWGLGAI